MAVLWTKTVEPAAIASNWCVPRCRRIGMIGLVQAMQRTEQVAPPDKCQMSIFSEISSASSTSMPRYRTVLSDLGMTEQQLYRTKVPGALVDQRCLCAPE